MIEILYKDADLLVCVKPQGIPSQPDPSGCLDMTAYLKEQLEREGERNDIFVIHRLDRATGGIMVYARNKKSAASLSELVAKKDGFEKHYLAVAAGEPSEKVGNMTDYIFRDSTQKKAFIVKSERRGAKLASLDYEVVKTAEIDGKTFSLFSIKLNTGRFHQIRAQLSSRGMPIYGDGKYGSRNKAPNFALWANKVSFTHRGKQMQFARDPDFDSAPWSIFKA